MKTTNPLPGMNPYLQVRWHDTHTSLIGYVRDALSQHLPRDLTVIAEESVSIDEADDIETRYRADLAVVEETHDQLQGEISPSSESETLVVAKPVTIHAPLTHRWLEIRNEKDRLITVIEVLSPSNKSLRGSLQFVSRQMKLLTNGVNTLDIDLIRAGERALPDGFLPLLRDSDSETIYLIVAGHGGAGTT